MEKKTTSRKKAVLPSFPPFFICRSLLWNAF